MIVNLSTGLVGEDNAALLGALLVTKIQMAALSRADQPSNDRIPFYLYVDEFQNFATDSFATILSEARKYALYLTVANQYIAQILPEVKDAVFGNVGTIVSFRTSADDARSMLRYFEPKFEEHDLVHMHNRHFVVSMTIEGEKVQAFSAITINLPPLGEDFSPLIIQNSRDKYAINRIHVANLIGERYLVGNQKQQPTNVVNPHPPAPVQSHQDPRPQPSPNHAPSSLAHAAIEGATDTDKPKRHRTRKRHKSPNQPSSSPYQSDAKQELNTEHVIKLR